MERKVYIKNAWEESNCQIINPIDYDFKVDNFNLTITLSEKTIYVTPNYDVERNETSLEYPIVLDGGTIKINPDYYSKNKNQIDYFISNLVNNFNGKQLILAKDLVNDSLLELIKNKALEGIILGSKKEPYVLRKSDLEYLKHIKDIRVEEVEDKLKDNIPLSLNYKPTNYLISYYNWYRLNNEEILYFRETLTDEEINNLKYIGNKVKTIEFDYQDYDNILKVISKLPNVEIKIKVKDKSVFPFDKFENFDNVLVYIDYKEYPVKYASEQEKKLENLVKDIKSSNLSPLEKYLAVYDIVKKFKKYKENHDNKQESRNLYDILSNDYIVCLGFSNLLKDLLDRVGIKSLNSSAMVILDGDDLENFDAWHARLLVYLNDPKYNLKGYFITDPTWDNKMDDEFYNYALMTPHERELDHVITYSSDNVYGVDTKEELETFLTRKDLALNRFIDNTKYFDLKAYNELFAKEENKKISGLEKMISDLDEELAKLGGSTNTNNSKVIDYEKIFNYIKENTCKEIKGTTIIDAAMEVYKFKNPNYTIEEYQNYRQKLIKSNFERQEKAFPKLERYNDETYEVMGGEHNKFSR